MEMILNNIMQYKYVYIAVFSLILLIVFLLIILKPKKIKPIEKTIDDVKEEKSEIEKVIEALEENKEERVMTTFEEEQEANAIISYQELVRAVQEKKMQNPENIKTVEPVKENIETPQELTNIESEEPQPDKENKFKNSEFISPVFGKDSNNDKFLKDLKDFRSSL